MKKLPKGISNYEELIEGGYYYVDKTKYIEKLESLDDKRIMFLRPRKFGKTLFTSVLENYYDKLKANIFDKLFSETYIGKNPTREKNSYCVLKFNFSGIDTSSEEATINGFKNSCIESIKIFIGRYGIDFYINYEQSVEDILNSLFTAFLLQKDNEKIYVIIDEYDHFANELLGFQTDKFKDLLSKNGKIRKWYEILKKATETVVYRIFITGVAPITLDSLTSGFNIVKDITKDARFNEMVGFNQEELIELMNQSQILNENQKGILPIMKEYYDGYRFAIDAESYIYNSNMCLNFLSDYLGLGQIPRQLVDINIASDYSKLAKMLDLCKGEEKQKIMEDSVSGKGIVIKLVEKFNPVVAFKEEELVSMLYYLGYLTIGGIVADFPILKIPNKVMKEIYSDYFLKIVRDQFNMDLDTNYSNLAIEIALEGKIDKTVELLQKYLNNLSNRDFSRFDEKYVKLIFYCIAMNFTIFNIKSEMEVQRKYPDLLIVPKDRTSNYNSVMIEFKYLKKGEEKLLKQKQDEAKKQIEEYSDFEEIKEISNLRKYTVVAVVDKVYVEEI